MADLDWAECKARLTTEEEEKIATERGLNPIVIDRLRERNAIGLCYCEKFGAWCIAFPISDLEGNVWRAHCRSPHRNGDGKFDWVYEPISDPDHRPIPAQVIGQLLTCHTVHIFESPWDGLALIDKLELIDDINDGSVTVVATRGAQIGNRLKTLPWSPNATRYAWPQNDQPDKAGVIPAEKWLQDVLTSTGGCYVVRTPLLHKDLNDWTRAGAAPADLEALIDHAVFERPQSGAAPPPGPEPFQPKGNSPAVYYKKTIQTGDILIGNGFLERDSAMLIAGSSGIGKSSIGMQIGCSWACGAGAFELCATAPLRVVMMQHEDSGNDLIRMSQVLRWCGLDPAMVERNFWIETVRGKIGPEAVAIMRELVRWWSADLLILNPLSAYHDGDISRNEDNVRFLYGDIGALLTEFHIGLTALHHDIKPPRGNGKAKAEENYHDAKYAVLGGSVLTNFFRAILTINAIPNSDVFRFTVAKRFEESGWPQHSMHYKWHEDRSRRLWVPVSVIEADNARKASSKSLEDLRKLIPLTGSIAREVLENAAAQAGFKQREYRALLAEACTDSTPDELRLYEWTFYNPRGAARVAYSRYEQPPEQTADAVKQAKRAREKQSSSNI